MAFPVKQKYHTKRAEENEQVKLTNYIKKTYPQAVVIGDAIGLITNENLRIAAASTRSDKGVSDMLILAPSRGYHGLVIELKAEGTVLKNKNGTWRKDGYKREYLRYGKKIIYRGDHIQEQVAFLEKVNKLGYFGRFAIGFYKAKRLVDWYFNFEKNNNTQMF